MKTKAIILVIATLIIGFFLGMLTSAQLRHHKMKSARVYSSEQRFRDGIYATIQPVDSQKVKIDAILNKYATSNRLVISNFRKELEKLMAEMSAEIEPLLTEEQLELLQAKEAEIQEMFRRGGNGPMRRDTMMNGHQFEGRRRGGPQRPDSLRGVRFKEEIIE